MYSQMYKINYMNHDAAEGWEAEIIRPKGTNDYDLILFKCDVLINLREKYEPIYPNACIIYSPTYPQYYRAIIAGLEMIIYISIYQRIMIFFKG